MMTRRLLVALAMAVIGFFLAAFAWIQTPGLLGLANTAAWFIAGVCLVLAIFHRANARYDEPMAISLLRDTRGIVNDRAASVLMAAVQDYQYRSSDPLQVRHEQLKKLVKKIDETLDPFN
jgi:hypothetical protein